MKEFIELIKKLWANKKTRALVILLLYLIFFIFVFALFSNNKQSQIIDDDPLDKLKNSEVLKLEFTGNHNFIVEDNLIVYNDINYNINEIPEELLIYDVSIFKTINMYNLIKNSILESKNYVENSSTYLISAKEFESIIYKKEIESSQNIRMTINDEITYVLIDLEEYYGYKVKIYLRS